MKKIITLLVLLCCISGVLQAQKRKYGKKGEHARLLDCKPTVYVTFERFAEREPLRSNEGKEGIWLRLHNNMRWRIYFPAFDVPKSVGEIGMFYSVEAEEGTEVVKTSTAIISRPIEVPNVPTGYDLPHTFSYFELPPGKSILFSVPREHLAKNLLIRISFNYDWEEKVGSKFNNEPKHYIYFYSSEIFNGNNL